MRPLLGTLVVIVVVAGCGGGPRVTESREVGSFDRLEVSGVDVTVVPGDGTQVRVRAGEDVMDRVRTESRDGVLRVDLPDRGIVIGGDPLGDVRVEVPGSALAGVRIDGSGDVAMTGIDADALELEVEGAGDIEASGTVGRLTVTLQGVGDVSLSQLAAKSAKVVVQGAADAELNVSDDLDVLIQGAGDVSYRGDPTVTSEVQGPGDVRREP